MPQRKGRRVPAQHPSEQSSALRPGERQQMNPQQLIDSLDPAVRQSIRTLALEGMRQKGRGLLTVWLNDTTESGIESASYDSLATLETLVQEVPNTDQKPLVDSVRSYNLDTEFVAMVVDVSPSLPGPQMWFSVIPLESPSYPPLTEAHERAMSAAYVIIEDIARQGYAAQGRGFVFYGSYEDGKIEPFVQYMTLDTSPGDGFVQSAPDLLELVRTYDPKTAFVVMDGVIDMDSGVLREVQIDIFTYYTSGKATPAA